ncbi:MAG: hypothetical protein ABFD90_15710 [Phycisphaerales bacterium]
MSQRIPHVAVRNAWVWVAVMALPPAVVRAATPAAPPALNTRAVAGPGVVQPLKQPPVRPVLRPAARTPASFSREMPLSEAIAILQNCTTPPLPIVVLWRDLDGAGVYRDTPIGIDGIPGLRLSQYLDLLVLSLSAGASTEIGYTVHRGVITIASTSALPVSKQITRVYDVRDLTAPPSNPFPPMGFGGMSGGQIMGMGGSYGGGLGMGYGMGMGSSYMPGGAYGTNGPGGLPGDVGGITRTTPGVSRRR